MAIPDIQLVSLRQRGDVFTPTKSNIDGGIHDALRERLTHPAAVVLEAGSHRLIGIPSTLPHTDGEHVVYWIDRINGPEPAKWLDNSWEAVAGDRDFLLGVEQFVRTSQTANPRLRHYFFIGFADGTEPLPDNPAHVYNRGLQSQRRGHLHAAELLADQQGVELDPHNPQHMHHLNLLLNLGGERAITTFDQLLEGFGERFTFTQTLGHRRRMQVERTMFGFSSLQEALLQSLYLIERVRLDWVNFLGNLAQVNESFVGLVVPVMQSCVPNIAFMFPTEEDRQNGNVKNTSPVWIMPFAITGTQSILVPGGIATQRG